MKTSIPRLRKKLASDPDYFRRVYLYTFEFARSEGQRSLGIELAQAFWGLLLPFGLKGGALRIQDNDLSKVNGGWTDEHTQLWYEFLKEKSIKGISKDTWAMARAFFLLSIRMVLTCVVVLHFLTLDRLKVRDLRHGRYVFPFTRLHTVWALRVLIHSFHPTAAWPSTIDDFVEWARERLKAQDAGFT
jgi:Cullin binding